MACFSCCQTVFSILITNVTLAVIGGTLLSVSLLFQRLWTFYILFHFSCALCVLIVGVWGLDVTWTTTTLCLSWLIFIPERDLTGRKPSAPWWDTRVDTSWYECLVSYILASAMISLIIWTDFLCCCTNSIHVAASEPLSHTVALANFLWGLCRNIYPSSTPVFLSLISPFTRRHHYFLSSCLYFGWSNILHQQRWKWGRLHGNMWSQQWSTCSLTPISNAFVDQPAQRKRNNNVSGPMNIDHRGSSFNTACLPFFVPYLIAVDWHES